MQRTAVLALMLLYPVASAAQPALSVEKDSVVATGVKPGGAVVWFSVAREPQGTITRVSRREEIAADSDQDGKVTFALEGEVPFQSIWVAVDLASGKLAAATPKDFPRREVTFPVDGFRPAGGLLREVHDARGTAEILVVRPAVGAWGLNVSDGGPADADGENDGVLASSLAEGYPIGASPPVPDHLVPGDVLVMIDPQRMEFYALSVPASALAGGQP